MKYAEIIADGDDGSVALAESVSNGFMDFVGKNAEKIVSLHQGISFVGINVISYCLSVTQGRKEIVITWRWDGNENVDIIPVGFVMEVVFGYRFEMEKW